MKTILTLTAKGFLLSVSMLILWIMGLELGNFLFQQPHPESTSDTIGPLYSLEAIFIVCVINTTVLLYAIYQSNQSGIKLIGIIFWTIFGIQFFLAQSESIFFNESLDISFKQVGTILIGGVVMAMGFSFIGVWLGGKMRSNHSERLIPPKESKHIQNSLLRIAILCLFVYPMLYILAGYFIAWQFEAVRIFYTGSSEKASFFHQLSEIIEGGIYSFQIVRALIWIAIGWLLIETTTGSVGKKALLVGSLFAILMNTQHLIPNPYMPLEVSLAHFVETFPSNFVWGIILTYVLQPQISH